MIPLMGLILCAVPTSCVEIAPQQGWRPGSLGERGYRFSLQTHSKRVPLLPAQSWAQNEDGYEQTACPLEMSRASSFHQRYRCSIHLALMKTALVYSKMGET